MSNKIVEFAGYDCEVVKQKYQSNNQQVALQLIAANTSHNIEYGSFYGEPIATATVCADVPCGENQTFIKNWRENEGVLEALVKAGIVEDLNTLAPAGYEQANLVNLLI